MSRTYDHPLWAVGRAAFTRLVPLAAFAQCGRWAGLLLCLLTASCLAGAVLGAGSVQALAAAPAPRPLSGKSDVPTVDQICNPRPAAGDILLPMPGGLRMVLRPISIPALGLLDAARLSLGIAASASPDPRHADGYLESRYTVALSAPFEPDDMPESWGTGPRHWLLQTAVSADGDSHQSVAPFCYFIGKYEVTRAQWRAVMQDAPFTPQPDDARPMTGISWFEALEFTRRYSEWLMQHHPEALPFFAQEKRSSFIRLPTEAEWEYAARGGHSVNEALRARTLLHPVPGAADAAHTVDMGEYIVASVYDATLAGLAPIGSRKPNPAGLHDVLGNSAEMVLSPFQLVDAGALLDNVGGFVIKGGSWRDFAESSLHPGRRIEAAYYVDGAAQRRDDMGLRVSLGTILTPRDRQDRLRREWQQRTAPRSDLHSDASPATSPAPTPVPPDAAQDVRVIIREVVREVESPALRQRLAEAESMASRYHAQVNAHEERMLREMLLGAAFSLETLANYAARCYQLIKLLDASTVLTPEEQRKAAQNTAHARKEIQGFIQGMRGALFYYRQMLSATAPIDRPRLMQQMDKLSVDFAHDDGFSRSMGRRLPVLRRHLEAARTPPPPEMDDLRDILPPWLLRRLAEYWS